MCMGNSDGRSGTQGMKDGEGWKKVRDLRRQRTGGGAGLLKENREAHSPLRRRNQSLFYQWGKRVDRTRSGKSSQVVSISHRGFL